MTDKVDRLALELLDLPASARAEIAKKLIASLDETDDGPVDDLWAEEAERRLKDIRDGTVQTVPAAQVLQEVKGRLSS